MGCIYCGEGRMKEHQDKPLPCARCKTTPTLHQEGDWWWVRCGMDRGPDSSTDWCWIGPYCRSKMAAINAWNALMRKREKVSGALPEEPLPCADCGDLSCVVHAREESWWVQCRSRSAYWCWIGPCCDTKAEAIAAWNAVMGGARHEQKE